MHVSVAFMRAIVVQSGGSEERKGVTLSASEEFDIPNSRGSAAPASQPPAVSLDKCIYIVEIHISIEFNLHHIMSFGVPERREAAFVCIGCSVAAEQLI